MLLDSNPDAFRGHFENHLCDMLCPDQLGAFILVLANSMQDDRLQRALAPRVAETYAELKTRYHQGVLHAANDDLDVFSALLETGIDRFRAWQSKSLGPWQVAYNPLRELRPPRASQDVFSGLKQAFDDQAFHFDRPFLKSEILSEEQYRDRQLRLLYQKFPFIPYHLLVLPEPATHRPQYLEQWSHQLAWDLTRDCADALPGFGLAYNSLGAGASVNHLHLHGFVLSAPFSIECSNWLHNGGVQPYPVQCHRMNSADECWQRIVEFHCENQPYNLLYRPAVCYVIHRSPQVPTGRPSWLSNPAWYELCGGFNLADRQQFEELTVAQIEAVLAKLKP